MSRCNRLFGLLAMVVMITEPSLIMAQSRKPIVAVFTIEDKGARLKKKLRERLSDYLAMTLAATGKYRVVPRDQLKKRLVAQKTRSYKKCYDQSCQIEIGKELAAQKSLSTVIMKLGSKCMVTSVLYNLRTAASEGGASAEGGCSEDAIVASIKKVVRKLVPGGKPPAPGPVKKPARPEGKGGLLVKSAPGGAAVTIDGQAQGGATPLTVKDLSAGEHVVEVRKGLFWGRQKVRVVANRFIKVTVAMKKVKGQLEVLSTPPEATVLLDGKEVGTTPLVLPGVDAGKHVLQLRRKGHVTARREVVLGADEPRRSINVTLVRAGVIVVTSDPAGAAVLLDGKVAGRTPARLSVEPGDHQVGLTRDGRDPDSRTVTVGEGKEVAVTVQLRLTEAERERLRLVKVKRRQEREAQEQAMAGARAARKKKSLRGYIALGSAGALLATAGVLYGVGVKQGEEAYGKSVSDVESARGMLIAGHVLAGLGLAAAGYAVYELVSRPEVPASGTVGVSAGFLPTGAVMTLRGSF